MAQPHLDPEWEPSENQQKLLKAAQEAGYDCSIAQMHRDAGLSQGLFYHWCRRHPEFAQWWHQECERWFIRQLPAVYAAICRRAQGKQKKGEKAAYKDAELFLNRFDNRFMPSKKHYVGREADAEPTDEENERLDKVFKQAQALVMDANAEQDADDAGPESPDGDEPDRSGDPEAAETLCQLA